MDCPTPHCFYFQHNDTEREVGKLQNSLDMSNSDTEKQISLLNSKIDKEIATLLATYERYRNDIMKYAAGKSIVKSERGARDVGLGQHESCESLYIASQIRRI